MSALAAQRPALAQFAARQAIELGDTADSWTTLGLTLRADASKPLQMAAGTAVLEQAAAKHEKDPRLAHAAGVAKLASGDAAAAAALLERAAASSADPDVAAALAAARRATKDYAGAVKAAQRALALDASHAGALRTLGLASWDAGDLAGAEDAFTKHVAATAAKRDPADPVPGWLSEVEALRKAQTVPSNPGETP